MAKIEEYVAKKVEELQASMTENHDQVNGRIDAINKHIEEELLGIGV